MQLEAMKQNCWHQLNPDFWDHETPVLVCIDAGASRPPSHSERKCKAEEGEAKALSTIIKDG